MNTRVLRIFLAVLAVVSLIAVLTLLIVESTAVKDDYYVSHAERMRAIEAALNDIGSVREGAENAREQGRPVPQFFEPALNRLTENNRILQDLSDVPRLTLEVWSLLDTVDVALGQIIGDARRFALQQNEMAQSLQDFQEAAPELVKRLRERNLDAEAQAVFSFAIEVFEAATGRNAGQLAGRIEDLKNTASTVPGLSEQIADFVTAATSVIALRAAAESALLPIRNSSVATELTTLEQALLDVNRTAVSRSERARFLLAVCAVLLLVVAAYAITRLQTSYRELNRMNTELEERVLARTEQLSRAYDDLKESQIQLIHAEKMSSLGEMVAGISHEINTPLWYLMNNSSVIQERLNVVSQLCDVADSMLGAVRARRSVNESVGRGLVEMNRLMKDGIRDDIDEAKNLIQDNIDGLDDLTALAQGLKDFSRLGRASKGEFDVNEGLDRTLLIAKNKLKYKATVHRHYGDLPVIQCSPSQINQVFLNLLTNAADSIEEHGDIVIHTSEHGDTVEISISDNGIGMAEDVLPKIRDPFFTTKEVVQGTGLGLSIVDRIVTEHGGELRIDSTVGKGTTVTIVLPTDASVLDVVDVREIAHEPTAVSLDAAVLAQQQTNREHTGSALSG